MKSYKVLGVKVQSVEEHVAKDMLQSFLDSDSQHQIVTVNPEFIVRAQKNNEFRDIINQASLATIDGAGIIKALQFLGHRISLGERLTGVRLSEMLFDVANSKSYKVLLIIWSKGLTNPKNLFIKIKEKYPNVELQIANETDAMEKAMAFEPNILLVGLGSPRQDIWIAENMQKLPSAKVAVGIGGTLDFFSDSVKRAPKIMRSIGLEWLWRLIQQPNRIRRMYRAVIVFPWLVFIRKLLNYESTN